MARGLGFASFMVSAVALAMASGSLSYARAESVEDAWAIALRTNQGLQSQQATSISDYFSLGSARSARLPTLRFYDVTTFLSQSPTIRSNGSGAAGGTIPLSMAKAGSPAAMAGTASSTFPLIGPNQTTVPIFLGVLQQPLYMGGRINNNIDAAGHQLSAQKTEEARTALDLKLTVAEAYVGVLRARKSLETAHSDVVRLASSAVDIQNRRAESLATRNDELAAEVSLANARISEITAARTLNTAVSTYNRYLCRPPTSPADLDELAGPPPEKGLEELAAAVIRAPTSAPLELNESEADELVYRALRARPELAGYAERALAAAAQARATLADIRPQISAIGAYIFAGETNIVNPNIFTGGVFASWTVFDGGQTRKKSRSLQQQEIALLKQKADLAADIALQVRSRWLDAEEARQRTLIASAAVAGSEENLKVVLDRYRNGLSIYTEVLDAENRRVRSINNYYNASYDQSLAIFRLRRAVGDL